MTVTYIESEGGKLAVEVDGEGPLIVCSPGLGDTRDAYEPVATQLVAAGYRVARVDLRGHGDSSTGFPCYGDEATAEDLLTVIESLGGGPAVLAGASMSAAAAVVAAGRNPDKVAGLVLLGPFLRNGLGTIGRWALHIGLAQPWGPWAWRYYAAKMWPGLGDVKAQERATHSTTLLTRPGRWEAFHASSAADHTVVAPWIERVKAPVLVVIGDSDPDWTEPLEEAEWVASNFDGAETVVVQGAGHAPMYECPDIVGPAWSNFVQKIEGPFRGIKKGI